LSNSAFVSTTPSEIEEESGNEIDEVSREDEAVDPVQIQLINDALVKYTSEKEQNPYSNMKSKSVYDDEPFEEDLQNSSSPFLYYYKRTTPGHFVVAKIESLEPLGYLCEGPSTGAFMELGLRCDVDMVVFHMKK